MLIQLFVNGIIAASIYALVGLGFALIYNTTRFFHFAHGVVYAAGAYLAYTFSVLLGLPLIISIILAIGLTTLIGMLMEVSIYRPLRINWWSGGVRPSYHIEISRLLFQK